MSYGVTTALQQAVFQRLSGDAGVTALVGGVFDALPVGEPPSIYVSLGPETVKDRSDKTGSGAEHDFVVSVISAAAGFLSAKQAAVAISDALSGADLVLSRGQLIGLWFVKAVAKRETGTDARRIDMRFRARVEDN
ncbi:hypothetical protein TG4357_00419 [Thalassovita gelatinovora]|uniref:Gene transfer agent protein n=1 Tax=Thalassovita gelatinovora TaxID=53501 RepID=A0A0P1FNK4_THAGE|nr:DUF3168 domain-containing protein [Thalassovita gelatinovora]QIZ79540.1 DUF3168 domain-containing protein [Thalassovita gelatinovora]CUH62996.1 hypothetical protein TG4357_00419 [Thalassovita gelatinovora]SEQ13817.1 Protein of unknown function [Thalassovita gelatinovora]